MSHKLGVYFSPGHNRPVDLDYIARLQPPVVRILDPDVGQIAAVYQAAPNALIMLRFWWLDDGRNRDSDPHGQLGQLTANPVETAYRHAMEWKRETDRLRNEAEQRGLTFPPVKQLMVSGVNEPNEAADAGNDAEYHALELKIAQYTSTFLDACYGYGLRAAALCLGVGHPARQLADGTPDWSRYMSIQSALTRGNHAIDLHAYWYMSGPQDGFGWYFGRERHCPLNAPIIVGETGVDNGVDRDRWQNERPDGARGWRGNIDAATYAGQIMWALGYLDPRVIAILPFTTDVRSDDWGAFDTLDAHAAILTAVQSQPTTPETPATVPPTTIHLPVVSTPPTAAPAEPQPPAPPTRDDAPNSTWQRSIAFVLRQEGGLSTDPNDPGNYVNGVFVGTKYGISARAHPGADVVNLTLTEAKIIYARDYWRASGANQMPWPMCLAHLDLAVNGGVGRAQQALDEAGPDFTRYMAWRLAWYTRLPQFDLYGRAWIRRCSDLMVEATRPA